jgi:hypothetical protein
MSEPRIQLYFHCKTCIENGDQQHLAAGWTKEGIQVFCETCNNSVIDIDFEGVQHHLYEARKADVAKRLEQFENGEEITGIR